MSIFENEVLWVAVLAWFIAQVIKVILTFILYKKMDFSRLVGSGGMPSSHTSFVTSLAVAVGLKEGFASSVFALSVVFALVVMYDAAGVRNSVGRQAKILNKIVEDFQNNRNISMHDQKLKELIGHTRVEVIAGAFLGTIIALLCIR